MVFFGVPSGPLEERDAALARGANIVEGYLIAPLDLAAPHGVEAYGRPQRNGVVVGLFTAPVKEAPCDEHERRLVQAGRGMEGDRYAEGAGTFSHPERRGQDLTLIEAEAFGELSPAVSTSPRPMRAATSSPAVSTSTRWSGTASRSATSPVTARGSPSHARISSV